MRKNVIPYEEIGNVIKEVLKDNYDAIILLTGRKGKGKTTLGIQLLKVINKEKFDMKTQLLASPNIEEIKTNILNPDLRECAFLIDEAAEIAYSKRWYDEIQLFLGQFYMLNRREQKCSIFCIPKIRRFNSELRNDQVNLWIEVDERGYAVAFVKNPSPAARDPWDLDTAFNFKGYFVDFNHKRRMKEYRKNRHYAFEFTFPDLELDDKALCENLTDKKKYKTLFGEHEERLTKNKRKQIEYLKILIKFVMEEHGLSQTEVAKWLSKVTGIRLAPQNISSWLSDLQPTNIHYNIYIKKKKVNNFLKEPPTSEKGRFRKEEGAEVEKV